MAVTTAAVVSAAAAAGSAAYGISAQRKQQKAQDQLMQSAQANAAGIFGTTPEFEPVDYTPLYQSDPGYAGLVRDILKGNLSNRGTAATLSGQVNRAISKASRRRIEGWDPSFVGNLESLAQTRDLTSQGYLPYEDYRDIVGARGRAGADIGLAGGTGGQTARDLGITRLQLMSETGPQLAAQITDIINAVDPIQRHSTPQEFLLPTQFGVGSAIQENQFAANFGFNQNMALAGFGAMPDPQAQGLYNLQAFQAGFAGSQQQAYAQGLGQLSSIAGMFGGIYGGGGGYGQAATSTAARQTGGYYGAPAGARSLDSPPVGYPAATGSTQYFG